MGEKNLKSENLQINLWSKNSQKILRKISACKHDWREGTDLN